MLTWYQCERCYTFYPTKEQVEDCISCKQRTIISTKVTKYDGIYPEELACSLDDFSLVTYIRKKDF